MTISPDAARPPDGDTRTAVRDDAAGRGSRLDAGGPPARRPRRGRPPHAQLRDRRQDPPDGVQGGGVPRAARSARRPSSRTTCGSRPTCARPTARAPSARRRRPRWPTRCSSRGETWRGRAFVVQDWYLSAYAPIRDFSGATVGMLYVGVLERPFTDSLWQQPAGLPGHRRGRRGARVPGVGAGRPPDLRAHPRHGPRRPAHRAGRLLPGGRRRAATTSWATWRTASTR